MSTLEEKFAGLGIDNKLQTEESVELRGEVLTGTPVNFCHGDVEAHEPPLDSLAVFEEGYRKGNQQAFSEFRGAEHIRRDVAEKLSEFTGAAIDAASGLILTPGTNFGAAFKNCIRINFSQEHDAAVEAIRRMGKLIERYRS